MATMVIVMSLPMTMLSLVFLESTSMIRFFLGVVLQRIYIMNINSLSNCFFFDPHSRC
jgi:hypothetical protein